MHVGSKVTLIDDDWKLNGRYIKAFHSYITFPVKNTVYTIRSIITIVDGKGNSKTGITLEEIRNPPVSNGSENYEVDFDINRFNEVNHISFKSV